MDSLQLYRERKPIFNGQQLLHDSKSLVTENVLWSLTCSWSSANRWALSSSESSVEDSDSEEESLELSEEEATGAKGGWGLTGAG